MKPIIATNRLQLREFNLNDASFILKLLNTPTWLQFIGDKQIKNKEDAKHYINSKLIEGYRSNGYGLWLIALMDTNTPIGMCGLVKRDTLVHTDIGFALLPEYENKGYGFESANAVIDYAKHTLKLNTILGITNVENSRSIKLLEKIGLCFKESLHLSENEVVLVYSSERTDSDTNTINNITKLFFEVFTNANGKVPDLEILKRIMIPEAIIINSTKDIPEVYSLNEFITPRKKLLHEGTLTDFEEYEVSNTTDVFKTIANRFSLYKKKGKFKGEAFETIGKKSFQFTKIQNEWKIASIIWSDEV